MSIVQAEIVLVSLSVAFPGMLCEKPGRRNEELEFG